MKGVSYFLLSGSAFGAFSHLKANHLKANHLMAGLVYKRFNHLKFGPVFKCHLNTGPVFKWLQQNGYPK
jgi:hypothetical protein